MSLFSDLFATLTGAAPEPQEPPVQRKPAPTPPQDDDDDDFDFCHDDEGDYNSYLSAEELERPWGLAERLTSSTPEKAHRLLAEAGVTISPHWPDGKVRAWNTASKEWRVVDWKGPFTHPSWEGSALFVYEQAHHWESAVHQEESPEHGLPSGWSIGGEPECVWTRHR